VKNKIEPCKIPFDTYGIWVIKDDLGGIIWVNLHNICLALKRREMIENGKALRICKTATKFPMYKNGKLYWFVKLYDIIQLTRRVRTESSMAAKLCDEVDAWVAKLPVGKETKEVNKGNPSEINIIIPAEKERKQGPIPQMDTYQGATTAQSGETNSLVVLQYEDQRISFKAENGMTYTNATEMARKYDKSPREWLLLADTLRFRQSLVERGITPSLESQVITRRGSLGATFLEQNLALEFARWLDPNFAIWMNKTNQELVKQGFVVLKKDTLETTTTFDDIIEQFGVPQTKSEALLLAAAYAKKIEEDKPKVDYYNDMVENRDDFTTSQISLELNISTVQLHRFLLEERIVKFEKKRYVVYPNHSVLQKDHPYMWTNKRGKTYVYSRTKRWTKAGREYIIDLYKQKNPTN